MTGFTIDFTHPWLLLILIPAFLASFIPYFTLNKKYRRTRNRITSLVLHTTSLVLAIMMLAGMHVDYTVQNTTNEIIILVDLSETQEYSADDRKAYLQDVISGSANDGYNVGVVTFGFNQVYAVPLTKDVDSIYQTYLDAEKPDTTASDIAAAIKYAASLFKNPESGKIVLITDGRETDEKALNSIRYVVSQNTRLDVAYVPASYGGNDIQLTEVTFPDYSIALGDNATVTLTFHSDYAINADITMSDNGVTDGDTGVKSITVVQGTNVVEFSHKFETEGLHKFDFTITASGDGIEQNNKFSTYYNLIIHNKVLLVSRDTVSMAESEYLDKILDVLKNDTDQKYDWDTTDNKYHVTSLALDDDNFPTTVDELREYDQVILNNVANSDLKQAEGFIDSLYSYVYDLGGGLFTIGGSDGTTDDATAQPEAHAYNRTDMYKTKYQEMLPVQAIDYTPPTGVIFLIDISGSMNSSNSASSNSDTKYDWAQNGIYQGVTASDTFSDRDYVGIIAFETSVHQVLPLTPIPQRQKIIKAVRDGIPKPMGGTFYVQALRSACQQLQANKYVEKKHIILLTDGLIPDSEQKLFEEIAYDNFKNFGITISLVLIDCTNTNSPTLKSELMGGKEIKPGEDLPEGITDYERMLRAVWLGNDTTEVEGDSKATEEKRQGVVKRVHVCDKPQQVPGEIRDELKSPQIKEVERKDYYPLIADLFSPLLNGVKSETGENQVKSETGENQDRLDIKLSGFYGTRLRAGAKLILKGDYDVPIYAQWKFGKGSVGSLMVDLYGEFSEDFIKAEKGKRLITNIVENLMTLQDLSKNELKAELIEDNYINKIQLATNTLGENEKIVGTIKWIENGEEQTVSLNDIPETQNPLVYVTVPLSAVNHYDRSTFIIKRPGTYSITVERVDGDGNVVSSYTINKSFSYSKEYDEVNIGETEELVSGLKNLADDGNGVFIDDIDGVDKVFETFITDLSRIYDPRTLFCILIIVMFLLDIAVRKFKFKWLHEIFRDIKNSKFKKQ